MNDINPKDIFFVGCNHVDDPIMLKYRPYFDTLEEHNDRTWKLLDEVKDNQIVVFMGDNFLTPRSLERLKTYKFEKIHILGNHEFEKGVTIQMLVEVMDEVHGCLKLGDYWLSHFPVHPSMLGRRKNIHAHMHTKKIISDRFINVSLDATRYRLISFQDIINGDYVPFTVLPPGRYTDHEIAFTAFSELHELIDPIHTESGELIGEVVCFRTEPNNFVAELKLSPKYLSTIGDKINTAFSFVECGERVMKIVAIDG